MTDLFISSKKEKSKFKDREIKKPNFWTEDEDKILKEKAKEYNYKNWNLVSKFIPGRTSIQCSARFRRIKPGLIKGAWGKEEDSKLLSLYTKYGKNWAAISKEMPHRTGKQIRYRFLNYFDTKYERGKFTKEEDNMIIYYYKIFGKSWAKIAKKIKTRTGDMIKNRFYSSLKNEINNNKNLLKIKRKRITSKFKAKSIKNKKRKIESQKKSNEIENKIEEKNDSKSNSYISLNDLNNSFGENCEIINQKMKMSNINSTNMISYDLSNSMNNYVDESNISFKLNYENSINELNNSLNSNKILSDDNENEINEDINKIENYNDKNNTNFNFEDNINKNDIINFYNFNDKYFNSNFFFEFNFIDNENNNFCLNEVYDEIDDNLEKLNNGPLFFN